MASKKKVPAGVGDNLGKALASIGVDKESVGLLTSSKSLGRIVVPVYWKDGLVIHAHRIALTGVPGFLRGFREVFPDGLVRWDPDYESDDASAGDAAIRIYFSYQEDDQGDHWTPPPTLLEEESYDKMLAKAALKERQPVVASKVLHAK